MLMNYYTDAFITIVPMERPMVKIALPKNVRTEQGFRTLGLVIDPKDALIKNTITDFMNRTKEMFHTKVKRFHCDSLSDNCDPISMEIQDVLQGWCKQQEQMQCRQQQQKSEQLWQQEEQKPTSATCHICGKHCTDEGFFQWEHLFCSQVCKEQHTQRPSTVLERRKANTLGSAWLTD